MTYKIEALVNGNWEIDAVGSENTFESKKAAEEMIPELSKVFDAPENEFRIVVVS